MFFAGSAMADAIIPAGVANIDGTIVVTTSTLTFFDSAGLNSGVFDLGSGSGAFTGLTAPDSIAGLTGGPATGPVSVIDFVTFTANIGLIHFDLTNIDPGFGTISGCTSNAVGNNCTTPGSPFTLTQVSANTVAFTFSLEGVFYTGSSAGGTSPGVALFTGQQVPGTITGVLATIFSTGSISNTYSATFSEVGVSETPEPGTLVMFLTGLLLVGIVPLRRAGRALLSN
jgi:hypothetical protein